ncbi:DJ-1 domain protein [Fusarium beomiforme]|uniref:DJ-1 domain protein n=1 Tax=Fusarium beomiforme TaxID=44412 RepID=A0A9P5E0I3_9HYPO|nr:DJ-1 domain protein [Fusarium beomiforme]
MEQKDNTMAKMHVCILMFQGHDVLDYTGPYEVFANVLHNPGSENPKQIFDITLIATDIIIQSSRSLCVNRHISIQEALTRIMDYDILIVPGGPVRTLKGLCRHDSTEVEFIRSFAALPQRIERQGRVILSVCTGALLLGYIGILQGRKATTHHKALDALRHICGSIGGSGETGTDVIRARYVDGGALSNGTRIVTSGGISSGIDASLYVLSLVTGREIATTAMQIMEFVRSSSLREIEYI